MTTVDIQTIAGTLRQKLDELGGSRRQREDIVIEKVSDSVDEVQLMCERELAIRNLDRDSKLIRQIRLALSRLDDETFGICLQCDEAISPKRIAALPWAVFCIGCQEKIDRREIEVNDTLNLIG